MHTSYVIRIWRCMLWYDNRIFTLCKLYFLAILILFVQLCIMYSFPCACNMNYISHVIYKALLICIYIIIFHIIYARYVGNTYYICQLKYFHFLKKKKLESWAWSFTLEWKIEDWNGYIVLGWHLALASQGHVQSCFLSHGLTVKKSQ